MTYPDISTEIVPPHTVLKMGLGFQGFIREVQLWNLPLQLSYAEYLSKRYTLYIYIYINYLDQD